MFWPLMAHCRMTTGHLLLNRLCVILTVSGVENAKINYSLHIQWNHSDVIKLWLPWVGAMFAYLLSSAAQSEVLNKHTGACTIKEKPLLFRKTYTLRWRHNGHDSVSNHQPHDCLLNRLFRRRSEKTSKLRVTGPCAGKSPGTGEFPAQMANNAENVSIWWRHHEIMQTARKCLFYNWKYIFLIRGQQCIWWQCFLFN